MHRSARMAARALAGAVGLAVVATAPAAAHEGHHSQNVNIRFAARAGDAPVSCSTPITGLGTTNATAALADLRFYVTDVRMVRSGGHSVPVKLRKNSTFRLTRPSGAVTLIDLENGTGACAAEGTAAMNAHVRGTVPEGNYTGVRFTIGVPPKLNHTDVANASAPLNLAAMGWSWQFGRKFMKIELANPGAPGTWGSDMFLVHVGSTGCEGDPATGATAKCSDVNEADVRLKRFDPESQDIAVDLRALTAGSNVTVNLADAPGCMSGPTDPECGGVFGALGIGWLADGNGSGRSPVGKQTLFKAIDR